MLNRDISGGLRGGCIEGGKGEMEKETKKFKYIKEFQVSGVKMDFLVNGTTTFSHLVTS